MSLLRKVNRLRPRVRSELNAAGGDNVLFTSVLDAVGRIDLADDVPIVFVNDRDELAFAGFLELLLEGRAFPFKGEESLLDLRRQGRIEVVDVAVSGGREGLRL